MIKSFLAGVVFTLACGWGVWQVLHHTTTARAQETYQMPTRGQPCATAILLGNYALTLEGVIVSGETRQHYAGIGVLNFDGQGGVALRTTQSFDGRLTGPATFPGRYALGDDCAGQAVFTAGARFELVSDNGGREVRLLQTNPGSVIQGTAKRQ